MDEELSINEFTSFVCVIQESNNFLPYAIENIPSNLWANAEQSQQELQGNATNNRTPFNAFPVLGKYISKCEEDDDAR